MSAIDILREKGLKKSAQRISIINILLDKQIPLTESDIEVEMGDMYDRITFYRTIQTLLEKGVIHRITIDSTTVKYALNTAQSHSHIHFYCKMCHAVTCFKEIPLQEYVLPAGFEQEECEVLIKGYAGSANDVRIAIFYSPCMLSYFHIFLIYFEFKSLYFSSLCQHT